jgi:nucleotide-binding universal stress UspA family protein
MTVVSGIDFSENGTRAALAAAAIAKRLNVSLRLVHVIDGPGAEPGVTDTQDRAHDELRERLHAQAKEIGESFGIETTSVVVPGFAHQKLIDIAVDEKAGLIVLASLGREKQHQWLLGSVAERVAQASPIPVLIVRESGSIEAWARGEKPLRVLVGVEIGATSKAALRWASKLREIGPCDLLVTHVSWPFADQTRLGIPSPVPLDHLRPEVHEYLVRELREWAGKLPGEGETTFSVRPGLGRIDAHLASLASELKADLLVVGAHQRASSARLWQGSVSRGTLHNAPCNVACVPRSASQEDEGAVPTYRRVLIPTDFSRFGNRAIPVGYGLAATGGIVYLLHVVTGKPGEDNVNVEDTLRALIPKGAAAKGLSTEVEVVHDENAWAGIWHMAERLGVDTICMATHGRSGISQLVLGSQAQAVVQRVRKPVFLVPPEREG